MSAHESFGSLQAVIDALANASFAGRGAAGVEAGARVQELRTRVEAIARAQQLSGDDAKAREQAAAAIDQLVETIKRIHAQSAPAIAKANPQLKTAFDRVDFGKLAAGLGQLAQWLRSPTPETTATVTRSVEQLRAILGQSDARDRAAIEAKLAADIDADVTASLDEIFRGKPKR